MKQSAQTTSRARKLRRDMTEAEKVVWRLVRNRAISGAKFRRQTPVGPYIADFLCHDPKLVIEIDGGQHSAERDAERESFLRAEGFDILRLWNNEVLTNPEGAFEVISIKLKEAHSVSTPPRATQVGEADTDRTISLDYASRYLRRRGLTTDQGEAFVLDLPEPTDLRHGDALILDDGSAIRVVAAPEPLAEVRASGRTLARLAWHIGNRHTPCEVREDRLLIQRDHVLEDMLRRLGA